jgi:N-acetylglucosaminyl-diphospho-decaprenol L-rhamnosyltransferase
MNPEDVPNKVTMPPKLSIIIVNWNSGNLLSECVRSLSVGSDVNSDSAEIVIVDNASSDNSLDDIKESSRITIIRNGTNRGFGAACNQGARYASGDELLFLNPDCQASTASIDACRNILQNDASIGVASVALMDDSGKVSRSSHRFPTPWHFFFRLSGLSAFSARIPDGSLRTWPHDSTRFVDHVIGAFYMVRARDFHRLGGFDERFFVYLEDLDLSLRYHKAGMKCIFLATPNAYHKGGGSSDKAKAARLFYSSRSRILYAFKHFSQFAAWLHLIATLVLEPLTRAIDKGIRGRFADIGEIAGGFSMLYRDLPAILRTGMSAAKRSSANSDIPLA